MNERIRKLYEQANIRHTNDYALSGKLREERRSIPDLFAELIVKECAQKLENDGMVEVAMEIKQHFGVE